MNVLRIGRAVVSALLATVIGGVGAAAQDFVVMGTPHVNLRTGPSMSSVVIGKAEKGDIFRRLGETGEWYEIEMFSGEARYVSKATPVYPLSDGQLVDGHAMRLPESVQRCGSMHRSVLMGLERAEREATELIPSGIDAERHANLRTVLEDRILLEMFHIYGLQPALYGELMSEGWRGG